MHTAQHTPGDLEGTLSYAKQMQRRWRREDLLLSVRHSVRRMRTMVTTTTNNPSLVVQVDRSARRQATAG